jgi:hypothetical protein
MKSKTPLVILVVVLLLCGLAAAWWVLKSRREKTPNMAPIAAFRVSIDQPNRIVTLSDGGSRDLDGTVQSWRIAWGDGQEQNFSSIPQQASHTYAAEGAYTIALWCIDNLGATSSAPAKTNITFDFLKRQKALEQTQADAKREEDRLKEEEAKKEAERLEQLRQKELAAQKAKELQELEAKRKAEAERARNKAKETAVITPAPIPLATALTDDSSSRKVIFTPPKLTIGEFQITKEKAEGKGSDGNLLVILAIRCVNFPETPIVTSSWEVNGKDFQVKTGRIRASLPPGKHEVTAFLAAKAPAQPMVLKADVTVGTNGECDVVPRK